MNNEYDVTKDKQELKSMVTLFKAYQSITKVIKKDIKKHSFDLNEFAVLEVMYHHKSLTVSEVNDKVLVNSSSLTYILDKLVKKGLIKRVQNKADKRVIYIEITDKGITEGNVIFPKHYELLRECFSVLTNEDKEMLITLNKKLGFNANKIGDNL